MKKAQSKAGLCSLFKKNEMSWSATVGPYTEVKEEAVECGNEYDRERGLKNCVDKKYFTLKEVYSHRGCQAEGGNLSPDNDLSDILWR
jgi:hypothetical protein